MRDYKRLASAVSEMLKAANLPSDGMFLILHEILDDVNTTFPWPTDECLKLINIATPHIKESVLFSLGMRTFYPEKHLEDINNVVVQISAVISELEKAKAEILERLNNISPDDIRQKFPTGLKPTPRSIPTNLLRDPEDPDAIAQDTSSAPNYIKPPIGGLKPSRPQGPKLRNSKN